MSHKNKNPYPVLKKVNDINPNSYRPKELQVINKNHKDISFFKKSEKTPYISFYNSREVHFSTAATEKFNLRIGMYAHFINDENYWYFAVTNDKDGFEIKVSNRRNSVAIFNSSLVKMFLSATGQPVGTKFLITPTQMEFQGKEVYKIDIHNPLEQVKKGQLKY